MDSSKPNPNSPPPPPPRINKRKSESDQGGCSPFKRKPVIIYTEEPRVIHVHARDFKAVVQKLTGQPQQIIDQKSSGSNRVPDDERGFVHKDSLFGEKDYFGVDNNDWISDYKNGQPMQLATDFGAMNNNWISEYEKDLLFNRQTTTTATTTTKGSSFDEEGMSCFTRDDKNLNEIMIQNSSALGGVTSFPWIDGSKLLYYN